MTSDDIDGESERFTVQFSRAYYDLARAASGPVPFHIAEDVSPNDATALVAWVSIPVVYSYMSIEALTNWHLYTLWKRRHDGSRVGENFLGELGDQDEFRKYRRHEGYRELHRRVRTLCRIAGFRDPQESIGP